MKTGWLLFLFAGLVLIWGYYGGQQAKRREYNCTIRVESLCFIWEKSDYGSAVDHVRDHIDRDVER